MSAEEYRTSPIRIALSWGLVGIPLAYGIGNTLITAAKLFAG